MDQNELYDDSFQVEGERKSSARVLKAIREAHDAFRDYQDTCDRIDDVYSRRTTWESDWLDPSYDLFWASMEILKPAIYAQPPVPVVAPMFADRRPLYNTTSEVLERVVASDFERSDLDLSLLSLRDSLVFTNRGVLWARYEDGDEGQRVCGEHLDRKDFLHEPAREWAHVGWVARRAWMTKGEMRKRFRKHSGDAYQEAKFEIRSEDRNNGTDDGIKKSGVWEVWHKADKKVYWVAEGCPVMLDHGDPFLTLKGFFPCPRPAYGTLQRRSLIPSPDYIRYASILHQINSLTSRIYVLLDQVKMRGLIPGGGDVGTAIQQLMDSKDDSLLISVPEAALVQGSSTGFVSWIPLAELAQTITGVIEARGQLINNFYELSGISDIMRGATDAGETLGAQQLKGQYGSVRIKDKVSEIQRLSRDFTRIVAEIAAEKFTKETILETSLMDLPSKADIDKQIKEIERAAKEELQSLHNAMKQGQQQPQQGDPRQMQAEFEQRQQAIVQKYSQQLAEAEQQVSIDAVMELLRDEKVRAFAFEIETDSTVLTDELAEKQSRNEFMQVVAGSIASLERMAVLGPEGAALAGGLLKFNAAPYRVGRELNSLIDDFISAAPQMAERAAQQGQEGGDEDLAAAQMELAKAELGKAEAQMAKVQADAALKEQELQQRAAEAQAKTQESQQKFQLEVQEAQGRIGETQARIEKIYAEIQLAEQKIGIEAHREQREDLKLAATVESEAADRAMNAQQQAQANARADRQQVVTERSTP